ncbi:MAG: TPM domain-containing protein [Saprospiraceae bacterium]
MNYKLLIGLLLLILPIGLRAQKEVPEPSNFLTNDYAGMLSQQEIVLLERKLRAYDNETSTQIAIVIEKSLDGENVFDYAHRLATTWGIGGGENDNGVLLFIAQEERKISIQTGYGSEGFLPDAKAFDIIQNILIPAFREGNYYQGINRAVDVIMDLGRGEYTNDGTQNRKSSGSSLGFWIFVAFVVLIFFLIAFGKKSGGDDNDDGGYYRNGRYDDRQRRRSRQMGRRQSSGGGWIFIPGGGGGFGGGGGSSSGGGLGDWGGFGGGDFGGGGAIG